MGLKKFIPFELKRGTSIISIIITLIILGILNELGAIIIKKLISLLQPAIPEILSKISLIFSYKVEINLLMILVFILFLFPIYRFVDRFLLKRTKRSLIFEDDFSNLNGWHLNYWGTSNKPKTNRIENGFMIFEANPNEVNNAQHQYGAYIDINNGIYDNNKYEIICRVKSIEHTTMKFQLWVHDTRGDSINIRKPDTPYTPSTNFETIKAIYQGNKKNALRIHLHNLPGEGMIIIDKVEVYKI
jgi:hypothetical protein